MKASLGALIVNVAVIHGAGLVLLGQQQAAPAARNAQPPKVMHLRLALADAGRAVPRAPTLPSQTGPQSTEAPVTDLSDRPSNPEAVPALASTPVLPPSQEAPNTEPPLQATTEEYVPRPRLSVSPSAASPVIVPFPAQFDGTGRYTSVMALYIDEDGTVRRIRFDDATLPPSMKDAARQAFLQAHFQPGQVKGQVVKSLIHIQVVFDNTPITPDTSYTTL